MAIDKPTDMANWGLLRDEGSNDFDNHLALAMSYFEKLLMGYKDPPHVPSQLEKRPDFLWLRDYLLDIKRVLSRFAEGDLSVQLKQKGATAGYIKAMQASLRHLAWQFNSVALGDLDQRVDYLGEFSLAFNNMTEGLKRQRYELEAKQNQLTALTEKLQKQIKEKEQVEAALRVSEFTYRQMALRDSLTGIYNRGYFFEIAAREIENLKRQDSQLCLIMVDVDHFKNYNDSYGHLAGDAALKMLTKTISGLLRKTDLFARYGGEEFVLLLPNTSLDTGLTIAERMRLAIFEHEPLSPDFSPITISLGVSYLAGKDIPLEEEVQNVLNNTLSQADAALYLAKENGRNQTWWHGRPHQADSDKPQEPGQEKPQL